MDHIALQLNREEVKMARGAVGVDYLWEAINRGTAIIQGKLQYMKNC